MPKASSAVLQPNLGLFFDRAPLAVPLRGLLDGDNFRVKEGKLTNVNVGYSRFDAYTLNGPVTLVHNFFLSSGSQILVYGTTKDLYRYVTASNTVLFITPIYATGTVDVSSATPAVVTSASGPTAFVTNGIKAGDQIHFGSATQNDPAAVWYEVATRDSETQLTLTTAVAGAPLTGSTYTIRKLFTGTILTPWEVSGTFVDAQPAGADHLYLTNGVDDIVRWNGVTAQVVLLSALAFKCRRLAIFQNMLIYGDITEGGVIEPAQIKNSDVGSPEVVDGTGLSGEFRVYDGAQPIKKMLPLGDSLVIYSADRAVLAQFVGDPLVFIFRTAFTNFGPIAPRLVADFGNFHDFIGADAKYRFDGVQAPEVGKQAWRDIIRRREEARIDVAFHHFDDENGELLWVLPLTTDPNAGTDDEAPPARAYVEHYLEQVGPRDDTPVSTREFPFTAGGFFSRQDTLTWDQIADAWQDLNIRWNDQFLLAAFPLNLMGANDGKVYSINTSQNADGVALAGFVRFGRRAVGDGRMRGLIARLYPFTTKFENVDLEVRTRLTDFAQGPISVIDTQTFDQSLPEGGHFVSPFRRARFVEFEFGTDGPSEPWEIGGYDVDMKRGGMR